MLIKQRSLPNRMTGRGILLGAIGLVMAGCSPSPPQPETVAEAGSQQAEESSQEEASSSPDPQRLYEVDELPVIDEIDGEERRRTGIVSSFSDGMLRLNENGQVFSYTLAADLPVHYPGGVTGIMDLRQGDKVTLFLEPGNDDGSTTGSHVKPKLIVQQIKKLTESVDR